MFIQIHTLTSYPATLLNRDDAGLAKRIPFGDATRLRVSSQCLKRHWTEALRVATKLPTGVRTRHFFSREVRDRLVKEKGMDNDLATKLTKVLAGVIMHSSGDKSAVDDELQLKQPVLFGKPEADYFINLIARHSSGDEKEAAKRIKEELGSSKKNFKALLRRAGFNDPVDGIEGALFGRFVTSDILARTDAPVHVAHAFTVHPLDTEVDFFTVVDDLGEEEETGAAHAGDMELGSGIFYGYIVIDLPLLVSNFTGCDRSEWRQQDCSNVKAVLKEFLRLIPVVSPGAKLGATAPYSYSDLVLFESGTRQPRSLANAYLRAIRPKNGADLLQLSVEALSSHLSAMDSMYGLTADKRVVATHKEWPSNNIPRKSVDEAIDFVLDSVFAEESHA